MSDAHEPDSSSPTTYSAAAMLRELELPVTRWRERHGLIQACFVRAIDPVIDLYMRSGGVGTGEAHFALPQMTARVINDLVVAVHLALHGYLNQAYNSLRMALEGMDARDLIAADASEASDWVNTDRPHVVFSPANVRERLGRERYDQLHGLFSERAHPRFAAAHLTGFMRRDDDTLRPTAVIRVGPFLLDEHPAAMEAMLYALDLTGQLTATSVPLVAAPGLSQLDLAKAIRACAEAVVAGGEAVAEELRSIGASGAEPVIARHRKIATEMHELLDAMRHA